MSSGAFQTQKYQCSEITEVVNIKVQPETITTWNPVPTDAVSLDVFAKVGGSGRGYGIHARKARFEWFGGAPGGYDEDGIITLPILTQAAYVALVKNVNYDYLGSDLRLVGKTSEKVR